MVKTILSKLGLTGPYRSVMLIAPAYDSVTRATCNWLRLRVPRGVRRYMSLGLRVSRADMENALELTKGLSNVKIFFGHGTEDALLGPPAGDESDLVVNGKSFSIIYDSEMIGADPDALFA